MLSSRAAVEPADRPPPRSPNPSPLLSSPQVVHLPVAQTLAPCRRARRLSTSLQSRSATSPSSHQGLQPRRQAIKVCNLVVKPSGSPSLLPSRSATSLSSHQGLEGQAVKICHILSNLVGSQDLPPPHATSPSNTVRNRTEGKKKATYIAHPTKSSYNYVYFSWI